MAATTTTQLSEYRRPDVDGCCIRPPENCLSTNSVSSVLRCVICQYEYDIRAIFLML